MATVTPYQRATRQGIRAAQQEHQRLGTDFHSPVEIFDVIEDERIWLFFQRLQGLYGAYQRYGDAAGIVVNSQHPPTVQRYTAAHEYGHHVLGHIASADDEHRINRRSQNPKEVAAQAFAGEFLMPLQLVNYTLRTTGLAGRNVSFTPQHVYQLALELGVSYSATVWQLVGQHKLTVHDGQRLRRESPLVVKTGLAGVKPEDSWADVWLLDESQEGREFSPHTRDEIHVLLAETPSTGYVWQLANDPTSVLAMIDDRFETGGDEEIVGASGLRHIAFRVAHPGVSRIRFEKRRPWQSEGQTAATFEATVKATGRSGDGLSDDQKQSVLAEGRAA